MASEKFLQQVVNWYLSDKQRDTFAATTFIMPNKRSAMFLKKTLQQSAPGTMFMPRITTLGRWVQHITSDIVADRNELLLTLYECYGRVLERHNRAEQLRDFDSFVYWGEILLNDFDDVDRALVDPHQIFSNIKNLKSIQADYLEPEQKALIKAMWGESQLTGQIDRFWLHTGGGEGDEENGIKRKFLSLWEILEELYFEFHKTLAEQGLTTQGMQLRNAVKQLADTHPDALPEHVAFVGFSLLSVGEAAIFRRMQKLERAAFFWDTASELLRDFKGRFNYNSAHALRMSHLLREFPMPKTFELETLEAPVDIDVIGVSSAAGQTKIAGEMLQRWHQDGYISDNSLTNTAVVLADESLLIPMLTALPASISTVNITMGLPFRTTPFAGLLGTVISMQLRGRKMHGRTFFFYEDLQQLVANQYFDTIAGEQAAELRDYIDKTRSYNLDALELIKLFPDIAYILNPVVDLQSVDEVLEYTKGLLSGLEAALSRVKLTDAPQVVLPEIEILQFISLEVETLARRIRSHGVEMSQSTFFHLFERVLAVKQINLNGMPLCGLQVMGMLETRVLDFDNIIVLSMNERIMPRRNFNQSLIPDALRAGYRLPTREDFESDYAYHFERLLSRARRAVLLYDSRSGGTLRSGEKSRFIARLEHTGATIPRISIKTSLVSMLPTNREVPTICIHKTPEVMAELEQFKPGGKLKLSASALKTYQKCPLQFYLQFVKNLRGDQDVHNYIDDATYGTIVHAVAERLYTPYAGKVITADDIQIMDEQVDALVPKVIDDIYYKNGEDAELPIEGEILCEVIRRHMHAMLKAEQKDFCNPSFRHIATELKHPIDGPAKNSRVQQWQVTPDLTINFSMSIDRVDEVRPGLLRFIDYKTGSDEHVVDNIDGLFKAKHEKDAIFQLLTYAEVYKSVSGDDVDIVPYVYRLRYIEADECIKPVKINKKVLTSYDEVREEFAERLSKLVCDIFSPEVDFTQASTEQNNSKCKFCTFLDMCQRTVNNFK